MKFIEHIIEPNKLLLAWQSLIVAEIERVNSDEATLTYLVNTKDFVKAKQHGFEAYPAFSHTSNTHKNVLDAFMRRVPPCKREDFTEYLEDFRIKPYPSLSKFALLGYSGAKLPSDGFSIIHTFENVDTACELLLEAIGFNSLQKDEAIKVDDEVFFSKESNGALQEEVIRILAGEKHIGYVTRGLIPTFQKWLDSKRIKGAWVEKKNVAPHRSIVYIYVKICAK